MSLGPSHKNQKNSLVEPKDIRNVFLKVEVSQKQRNNDKSWSEKLLRLKRCHKNVHLIGSLTIADDVTVAAVAVGD